MKTVNYNGEELTVHFETYQSNGNIAITLTDAMNMPYAKVTTNLGKLPPNLAYIADDYEAKYLPVDELIEAGILKRANSPKATSGFNTYTLYAVNTETGSKDTMCKVCNDNMSIDGVCDECNLTALMYTSNADDEEIRSKFNKVMEVYFPSASEVDNE